MSARDEYWPVARAGDSHGKNGTHDQPFDRIMAGDVVDLNGTLRKVRAVTRYGDDCVYYIEVAKVHRSGYPSPTTFKSRYELMKTFRGIVGRASLCTVPVECAMQRWIDAGGYGGSARDLPVTERDTVGVIT